MRNKIRVSLLSAIFGFVGAFFSISTAHAQQLTPEQACALYSQFASQTGVTAGAIGGGNPLPLGAVITVSTTFGTATSGTFSIIGSPSGTPVLAGPGPIPGTLSYTVTLAQTGPGAGWLIDTANGTVNVAASCSMPAVTAPALSPFGLFACGLMLLALGSAAMRYKAQSRR